MGKGDDKKKSLTLDSGKVVVFVHTKEPLVSFLYCLWLFMYCRQTIETFNFFLENSDFTC